MLSTTTAAEKRSHLAEALGTGRLLRFPGAFSPFIAVLIEREGFDGVYVSGAGIAADLALPDIGLTTQSEVVTRAGQIARASALPAIVDIDTGFGEPMNAARTVQLLEDAGLAGCHLEDQLSPKRCGHLENKEIVPAREMVNRVRAAADALRHDDFLLIARTDARASEGLEKAIERAKAYVDAGARMIFPEALEDEREFEAFRKAIDVPLLANMTEFGKSPLLSRAALEGLGYNIVIYPMSSFRLAMKAVEDGLHTLNETDDQAGLMPNMMTRAHFYEVVDYAGYARFDKKIFNID
jgi:methylisocitrate lyase